MNKMSNFSFDPENVKEQTNLFQGVETYTKLGFEFKSIDGKRMPEFPQVLYTLTGNWKGWNDILETDPNSKEYSENDLQDKEDLKLFGQIWDKIIESDMEIPHLHFKRIWEKISGGRT